MRVTPGNLVRANDTGDGLVTITQLKPLRISFSLPERELDLVRAALARNGAAPVRAYASGATQASATGKLFFVDSAVDTLSGTITAKAMFDNEGDQLWPGQYVRIEVDLGARPNVITVPLVAVSPGQGGTFAFVVKADGTVERHKVEIADSRNEIAVIASGISPGEQGRDRRPGAAPRRLARGREAGARRAGRGRHGSHRAGAVGVETMNISELFIRRPVATILLSVALTLGGLFAYRVLPVAALPTVDFPTVSVSAQLAGAAPETMATSIATPLIKEFSTIPSIQTISATNYQGFTSITIEFELNRNIDQAAADVQAAIARTQRRLPAEMTTPPSYRKLNPADAPVLLLALQSDTEPLSKLDAFAQTAISPNLSTISGVGQVQIYGSQKYAVRVQLNPNTLAARGIGIDEIQTAIAAANVNTPIGTVEGNAQNLTIQANTQLRNADAFRDIIVAVRNGNPVRLGEVATVIDLVENTEIASWYDGKRALVLAVQRQPGANTVEVVDKVKEMLPKFQEELGPNAQIHVMLDRSASIREAVHDVQLTLGLTIVLVILVIYLFLGRLTATLIPGVAVPISIIATFGAMYAFGYSIDNISLLGLTLAVGLVVDDAIVMLENIVRHVEEGMSPFEAALKGSGEIGFTILSITVSLVAVFIPVLLMGGVVGRIFNEFAVVVTIAIAASALISLTLTPMLAARLPSSHARRPREEEPVRARLRPGAGGLPRAPRSFACASASPCS